MRVGDVTPRGVFRIRLQGTASLDDIVPESFRTTGSVNQGTIWDRLRGHTWAYINLWRAQPLLSSTQVVHCWAPADTKASMAPTLGPRLEVPIFGPDFGALAVSLGVNRLELNHAGSYRE
jgi:hypothetical protein